MVLRSDSSELRLRFEDLVNVDGRLPLLHLTLVPATSAGTSSVEEARKPLLFDRVRTLDFLAVKSILKVRTKGTQDEFTLEGAMVWLSVYSMTFNGR
jgi:hypothetical protein